MTTTYPNNPVHRGLLLAVLFLTALLAVASARADSTMIPPRAAPVPPPKGTPAKLFHQGEHNYVLTNYAKAVRYLKAAVQQRPKNAQFHYWLGKAYGRLAEHSNWFSAMALSRKTLNELKTAVDLDKNYVNALQDLMEYYKQAPGFLGGSREKAQAIAKQLELLEASGVTSKDMQQDLANSPS